MTIDRSARAWLDRIADPDSWAPWHQPDGCDCDERSEIATGTASIGGVPVTLVLTGSRDGVATLTEHIAGELTTAFDRAVAESLPVFAVATSAGVRLQEGTPAFVSMTDVAAAVARHRDAGLLFTCYLADPTTGGTLASWAGAASVRLAEPGALIAFAGPRVVELTTHVEMPVDAYRAEALQQRGVVDIVVAADGLRDVARTVLRALIEPDEPKDVTAPADCVESGDAWDAVQRTRRPDRPGARELLGELTDVVELKGDGLGAGDEPTMIAAFGRLRGRRVAFVGHDRSAGAERAAVTPAGLRKAQRVLRLAESFGVPLVSVVDTPGARLDEASGADDIAFEISAALTERSSAMSRGVRLVCVLLGEGGGGAALAFVPAQHVVAAQSAWLAPLPPEGSSAVLHRDVAHADEAARAQHITAADLHAAGRVQTVVAESADWIGALADAVAVALDGLS
ncbi:MAG TPA: carboxyl transferase domain-containing protein [Jatrophihabitantaceae bacterium]|nr:carboxyl transferase domain-containing protein [Jatrophihabitantaceae bacterium]